MRRSDPATLGGLLVALGVLFVLSNAGVFGDLPGFIRVVLLFALGGFLWVATAGRVPFLLRLMILGGVAVVAMAMAGRYAGTAALGFPALIFALVYGAGPRNWWALIPAGVLGSLALLVTAEALFPRWDATPVLFLGFAATFTMLYLRPRGQGGQRWALYPALGWIALTVLVNDPSGGGPNWLLPLVLIGAGIALLWYWQRRHPPG